MFLASYETITNFIADKCEFISPDIEFLSIHTGGGTWRRYKIEDKKVSRAQFFVENLPNLNYYIDDITNVPGTNRLTIKLGTFKSWNGDVILEEIKTVGELARIISPKCIDITVNNVVEVRPLSSDDNSVIQVVSVSKHGITIYVKF